MPKPSITEAYAVLGLEEAFIFFFLSNPVFDSICRGHP